MEVVPGSFCGFFTAVYSKCTRAECAVLWVELQWLHSAISALGLPWLARGNFKDIADPTEYSGRSSPDIGAISNFQQCISCCDFLVPPSSAISFT